MIYDSNVQGLISHQTNVSMTISDGKKDYQGHKNSPMNCFLHTAWQSPQTVISSLLEAGSNLSWRDHRKRTALHLVVNSNIGDADASSDMEEWLIAQGADLMAKDSRGRLPLHYAFVKIKK